MKLSERTKPVVILDDIAYPYRDDFRLFLKAYEILQDEDIFDEDKIEAICGLIFKDKIDDINLGSRLIRGFFRKYNEGKGGEALFSFEQDAEYIYAGFMQAYGINLFTKKLTIEEFMALLKGLPKGTRFSEVVEIRAMPVPKQTKYNSEQISAILRAKQSVRLKADNGLKNGWQAFGDMIKTLARRK